VKVIIGILVLIVVMVVVDSLIYPATPTK